MKPTLFAIFLIATAPASSILASAESGQMVLHREPSTMVVEPYAPNIARITLSLLQEQAVAPPGYGFTAAPSAQGRTQQHNNDADVYRSSRLVVSIDKTRPAKPMAAQVDIARFFNGSVPPAHVTIRTPDGKILLEMTDWAMSVPNHKDGNAGILQDRRPTDPPFYQVGATFTSPPDEHYYGLGQNQEGFLDLRGHAIQCWHNYTAAGGPGSTNTTFA